MGLGALVFTPRLLDHLSQDTKCIGERDYVLFIRACNCGYVGSFFWLVLSIDLGTDRTPLDFISLCLHSIILFCVFISLSNHAKSFMA